MNFPHKNIFFLLSLLAIFVGGEINAQLISTVAGTGYMGFNGNGIPAASAQLYTPNAVTLDAAGNLYISDFQNNMIRKVTASTGLISTLAGTGTGGYNGDGIAATSAQLSLPKGVAVDAAGNIYFSDYNNNRIRKVDISSGLISTLAGTGTAGYNGDGIAATTAQVNNPYGIALDNLGNIYFSDYSNNRVREINVSTGLISTVAGTGTYGYNGDGIAATTATMRNPSGIALDGSGNIYFAEYSSHRVREVTVSTGLISTIAGTGLSGFTGDGLAATSAKIANPYGLGLDAAGNVYITNYGDSRIRKVTVSTGLMSTLAGTGVFGYNGDGIAATTAKLNRPEGIAIDASGNIYIADANNFRIRQINAGTGLISTFAGTGAIGYNGDGIPATSAEIYIPEDVAVDAAGNIFIADALDNRVRKVDASTGLISTIAGTGATVYNGDGIAATTATLALPRGVVVDAAGNVYIAENSSSRIRKVTAATGLISTIAGTGTAGYNGDGIAGNTAQINFPYAIALDASANVYIAEEQGNRIRKVDAITGIISTVAGTGVLASTGDGGAATAAQLFAPTGVAVDASGNIYIAEFAHRVRKVTASTGIITTIVGTGTAGYNGDGIPATTAQVNEPLGISLDAAGNLYIADYNNNRIRKVDASSGLISTIAGTGVAGYNGDGILATSAQLLLPQKAVVDAAGLIYIADWDNARIRRVGSVSLPIQLLYFSAQKEGSEVLLNWETATETNNDFFTIERSPDAKKFEPIIKIKGAGNSSGTLPYSTVDPKPLNAVSYYRLKQTDFDGKFTYSNIVAVEFNDQNTFTVYPNPTGFSETSYIKFDAETAKNVLVIVYDENGRELFSKVSIVDKDNSHIIAIDPSSTLPPGVYLISASSENSICKRKLIIR